MQPIQRDPLSQMSQAIADTLNEIQHEQDSFMKRWETDEEKDYDHHFDLHMKQNYERNHIKAAA